MPVWVRSPPVSPLGRVYSISTEISVVVVPQESSCSLQAIDVSTGLNYRVHSTK
jgi:hypothetical protein